VHAVIVELVGGVDAVYWVDDAARRPHHCGARPLMLDADLSF
jgi:hypothetical protein